jgi:hypothetical protein
LKYKREWERQYKIIEKRERQREREREMDFEIIKRMGNTDG